MKLVSRSRFFLITALVLVTSVPVCGSNAQAADESPSQQRSTRSRQKVKRPLRKTVSKGNYQDASRRRRYTREPVEGSERYVDEDYPSEEGGSSANQQITGVTLRELDKTLASMNQRLTQIEYTLGLRGSEARRARASYNRMRHDVNRLKSDMRTLRPLVVAERAKRRKRSRARRAAKERREKIEETKENVARSAREAGRQAGEVARDTADAVRGTARQAVKQGNRAARNAGRAARQGAENVRKGVENLIPGGN